MKKSIIFLLFIFLLLIIVIGCGDSTTTSTIGPISDATWASVDITKATDTGVYYANVSNVMNTLSEKAAQLYNATTSFENMPNPMPEIRERFYSISYDYYTFFYEGQNKNLYATMVPSIDFGLQGTGGAYINIMTGHIGSIMPGGSEGPDATKFINRIHAFADATIIANRKCWDGTLSYDPYYHNKNDQTDYLRSFMHEIDITVAPDATASDMAVALKAAIKATQTTEDIQPFLSSFVDFFEESFKFNAVETDAKDMGVSRIIVPKKG